MRAAPIPMSRDVVRIQERIYEHAKWMDGTSDVPWKALAVTRPIKLGERPQIIVKRAKKLVPKRRTRRWLFRLIVSMYQSRRGYFFYRVDEPKQITAPTAQE